MFLLLPLCKRSLVTSFGRPPRPRSQRYLKTYHVFHRALAYHLTILTLASRFVNIEFQQFGEAVVSNRLDLLTYLEARFLNFNSGLYLGVTLR